jgi:hypothetical protein
MWILNGHEPIPAPDLLTGAVFFENSDARRVAETHVGPARVSTVFLGIDHNFSSSGPPVLFESMIFLPGEEIDEHMRRYVTWDEAEAGHAELVAFVQGYLSTPGAPPIPPIPKPTGLTSKTAWERLLLDDEY